MDNKIFVATPCNPPPKSIETIFLGVVSMNSLHKILIASCFTLILLLVYVFIPRPSIALKPLGDDAMIRLSPNTQIASVKHEENLKPLDDDSLEVLSPATTENASPPLSPEQHSAILQQEFESSMCFQKCHQKNDFSPSDKTKKQWQALIENNGHDVFEKLSWETPQKKEYVLLYLYENAKNTELKSEGIGVWKP